MLSTEDLMNRLKCKNQLNDYLDENKEEFVNCTLVEYLETLLNEKGLKKTDVIKDSAIERTYAYQIFNGVKNPSRNRLIQLCIGMKLSLDETQGVLKHTGFTPLYPRKQRDSIIIYAINNELGIDDIDELLYDKGFEVLQ